MIINTNGCVQIASTQLSLNNNMRKQADLTTNRRRRMQQRQKKVAKDIAGAMVCLL
jgi:hypothetical protein